MQEKQNPEGRTVLTPDCHHRMVPKVILGLLQILQISWGVSVVVISTPVLGKCEPQPALLLLCSKGKESSRMGEMSWDGVSAFLGRLFDPVPGARTGVIPL